jgi:hypothetical protein
MGALPVNRLIKICMAPTAAFVNRIAGRAPGHLYVENGRLRKEQGAEVKRPPLGDLEIALYL